MARQLNQRELFAQMAPENCSICYDPLNNPTRTECNHFFCLACLQTWLTSSNTCPQCRHQLYETDEQIHQRLNRDLGFSDSEDEDVLEDEELDYEAMSVEMARVFGSRSVQIAVLNLQETGMSPQEAYELIEQTLGRDFMAWLLDMHGEDSVEEADQRHRRRNLFIDVEPEVDEDDEDDEEEAREERRLERRRRRRLEREEQERREEEAALATNEITPAVIALRDRWVNRILGPETEDETNGNANMTREELDALTERVLRSPSPEHYFRAHDGRQMAQQQAARIRAIMAAQNVDNVEEQEEEDDFNPQAEVPDEDDAGQDHQALELEREQFEAEQRQRLLRDLGFDELPDTGINIAEPRSFHPNVHYAHESADDYFDRVLGNRNQVEEDLESQPDTAELHNEVEEAVGYLDQEMEHDDDGDQGRYITAENQRQQLLRDLGFDDDEDQESDSQAEMIDAADVEEEAVIDMVTGEENENAQTTDKLEMEDTIMSDDVGDLAANETAVPLTPKTAAGRRRSDRIAAFSSSPDYTGTRDRTGMRSSR